MWNLDLTSKDELGNILDTKTYTLQFNNNGSLISPQNVTITTPQDINIDISNVTAFQTPATSIAYSYTQDGIAKGYLKTYEIDDNGNIKANFSNNQTVTLAQIPIMHFVNDQGLANVGGNLFEETANSGKGEIFLNNGEYISGAAIKNSTLETSNVNMSQAMTELIVTQKAFSASAKTVTTSDQMIQTAINMKMIKIKCLLL